MSMTKTMKTTTRNGYTVRTDVQVAAPEAGRVARVLQERNAFRQMRGQALVTETDVIREMAGDAQAIAEHAGPVSRRNLRTGNRPALRKLS